MFLAGIDVGVLVLAATRGLPLGGLAGTDTTSSERVYPPPPLVAEKGRIEYLWAGTERVTSVYH